MDPLTIALLGLALGLVTLLATAVARRTGLPDPVVLVAAGVLASFLPFAPSAALPPDLVFLLFLPPLVFRASFLTSPRTLRRNVTPLVLLSVGLVLVTAFLVATVLSLVVPGLDFAEGLVLGAVVAPTDPVAATTVFSRLGAPRRVVDLLEGESLINDAIALVLYAVAVQVVVSGTPTVAGVALQLGVAVLGGVAVGLLVGTVVVLVRRRIDDVGLQLLLSLVTPFLAYLPADRIGASGVLAVVTTGVLAGGAPGGRSARARLQTNAFWALLDLVLNAVLFVLLGLQVRHVLENVQNLPTSMLALYGAILLAVVVGARLVWQLVVPPPVYRLRQLAGRPDGASSRSERLLVGWTGIRGAISLAAALALPLEAHGQPFPERALLVFLTVVVVLGTLLLQGTTLPVLLVHGPFQADAQHGEQERELRIVLADVALARLEELEDNHEVPPGSAQPLRELWQHTRSRMSADDADAPEVDLVALRLDITRVQGVELERRRRAGNLAPEVVRELRQELDLQQVRLSGPDH